MDAAGGPFELPGTIGQPDAGVMAGGPFELTGGFWFSVGPGDCDEDGVQGLMVFAAFSECLAGPNAPSAIDCGCFDVNADDRVDMADFAMLQNRRACNHAADIRSVRLDQLKGKHNARKTQIVAPHGTRGAAVLNHGRTAHGRQPADH